MRAPSAGVLSLLLCLAVVPACGADDPTPAPVPTAEEPSAEAPRLLEPEVPEQPPIDVEAEVVEMPSREELDRRQEEWRDKMDQHGRGLISSFESRVFDPVRDAELRFAEGLARVRVGDAEGSFRITFDVTRPRKERVTVVPEGDGSGLPSGSEKQVRKFADLTLSGPYRTVVQYYPPIRMQLTYSKDRKYKIVVAPPHKHNLQVSYRFDERELISHRGISVRPAAEITKYEWTFWRGRYLMSRFWVHGTGGTCDLEYDDRDTSGVVLLRRALLQKGDGSFDVAFSWERVEAGKPVEDAPEDAEDER